MTNGDTQTVNSFLLGLGQEVAARAAGERFLTLSEGLVKVRCLEAALALGWTVQEGAGQSPSGPVADFANLTNGQVRWSRGPRRLASPEGSADLAIVHPFSMLLEIKSRPDYGTKAQAQFQEMDADVERVARFPQCAFLFVFDAKIYLSFSGAKAETRGRRAIASQWFVQNFLAARSIPDQGYREVIAIRNDADVALAFGLIPSAGGEPRVIVLGCRTDARFGRNAENTSS